MLVSRGDFAGRVSTRSPWSDGHSSWRYVSPLENLVALNLAAWVSAGADWPDGRGKAPCGNVILMCRQDNLVE
jgi:hypothetical protein